MPSIAATRRLNAASWARLARPFTVTVIASLMSRG